MRRNRHLAVSGADVARPRSKTIGYITHNNNNNKKHPQQNTFGRIANRKSQALKSGFLQCLQIHAHKNDSLFKTLNHVCATSRSRTCHIQCRCRTNRHHHHHCRGGRCRIVTVAAHHARQCTCARARGQQNVRPCCNHANRTDSRYTANKRNGNICVITSRATRKCTVMHRAAHRARAHFQPGEHRSLGVRLVRIHACSIHPRSFAMRATTFYLQLEAILRTNHSMMMHCRCV